MFLHVVMSNKSDILRVMHVERASLDSTNDSLMFSALF
jgi:hypothetical protein